MAAGRVEPHVGHPPHRAKRQRRVEVREQRPAAGGLPAQRVAERRRRHRDQQQVRLAGEVARRRLAHLLRGREVDEAVARVGRGAVEGPRRRSRLPGRPIDQLEHRVRHGRAVSPFNPRPQHDDVLPGQHVDHAFDAEAVGAELLAHLADAHLVLLADRHARILAPELDQHQPAVALQRLLQLADEDLRRRQLVVDVDHQQQVERLRRQHGIVGASLDDLDVGHLLARHSRLDDLEHARLQVGGDDAAGRSDGLGQADRVVARSRADVGDDVARLQAEGGDRLRRRFFLLALGTIEPRRAFDAHRRREHASTDRVPALLRRARDHQGDGQHAGQHAGKGGRRSHPSRCPHRRGWYHRRRPPLAQPLGGVQVTPCTCAPRPALAR